MGSDLSHCLKKPEFYWGLDTMVTFAKESWQNLKPQYEIQVSKEKRKKAEAAKKKNRQERRKVHVSYDNMIDWCKTQLKSPRKLTDVAINSFPLAPKNGKASIHTKP
jgi:hypothetical protein